MGSRHREQETVKPIDIQLHKFHAVQREMYKNRTKRDVWRCGRRFGKTTAFEDMAANWAIRGEGKPGAKGHSIGWFSPNYKLLLPSYKRILRTVKPLVLHASKIDGIIELVTGGSIEFWTLNDEDAGRSRAYKKVLIDEAGLVKKGLKDIWDQSIEPTLLDYNGDAVMAGTPKGEDPDSFFYQVCTDKSLGWREWHAPTRANPMMSGEALDQLKNTKSPLVWQQEYEAAFVNWNGVQFFELSKFLDEDGYPYASPLHVDGVFATIDTAIKTGSDNDGTAVTFWAVNKTFGKPKLFVLDWDILQIQGNLLETWLPTVYQRLEVLAQETKARNGSIGAWVEDKGSGTILIQQAQARAWPCHAIESALTAVGKDERAISVSGYVYNGDVGITKYAFEKVKEYKEQTKNHFMYQVFSFRIGDKEAAKRSDDLLDTLTYGVAIALGNSEGY